MRSEVRASLGNRMTGGRGAYTLRALTLIIAEKEDTTRSPSFGVV